MVKVAALADIHCSEFSRNVFKPTFQKINNEADILLLPGDLTRLGKVSEAYTLADELSVMNIPVFAVLGNHDYHSNEEREIVEILSSACVVVLDGEIAETPVDDQIVGIVGTKGFGGGFGVSALPEFGEQILKLFYRETVNESKKMESGLAKSTADITIAMLHYSPIAETLLGEPSEIYAFLGSSFLSEAVDKHGADIVIHGHAHFGTEEGETPAGIPVRNVSLPMLGRPYAIYEVDSGKRVRKIK